MKEYEILEIDAGEFERFDISAKKAKLKKQYFRLAQQWHPDKNSTPEAKTKFQQIEAAYNNLLRLIDPVSTYKPLEIDEAACAIFQIKPETLQGKNDSEKFEILDQQYQKLMAEFSGAENEDEDKITELKNLYRKLFDEIVPSPIQEELQTYAVTCNEKLDAQFKEKRKQIVDNVFTSNIELTYEKYKDSEYNSYRHNYNINNQPRIDAANEEIKSADKKIFWGWALAIPTLGLSLIAVAMGNSQRKDAEGKINDMPKLKSKSIFESIVKLYKSQQKWESETRREIELAVSKKVQTFQGINGEVKMPANIQTEISGLERVLEAKKEHNTRIADNPAKYILEKQTPEEIKKQMSVSLDENKEKETKGHEFSARRESAPPVMKL